MAEPILDIEGTGYEIAERLASYADRRIRVILLPATEPETPKRDKRPVAEVLAEIAANIPPEEIAKLPDDFTNQLDHYVYGTPKR